MNDLISRQAAIEVIYRALKTPAPDYRKDPFHDSMGLALAMAQSIPSAQPQQRWIPCSKRLPDIGEHHVSEPCLVYCDNGAYGFAELEENIFGQVGWNCERDDDYHEPLGTVIAWQPLPEPYKVEHHE